jgi:RHS repeat-associated protein
VRTIQDPDGPPRAFEYDAESRLVKMTKGPLNAELRYGPFGELIQLDVRGDDAMKRRDRHFGPLLEESVGSGSSFIDRRIPGPMGVLAARRTQPDGSDGLIFPHGDDTANRLFTDATGKVIQRVEYRPYGEITEDTGEPGSVLYSQYLWNGGETFKPFGLTLLGARAYDPTSGRFLQRDPLILPTTASSTNPYSFAFNDPVNFSDSSGMSPSGPCDELNPLCGQEGSPIGLVVHTIGNFLANAHTSRGRGSSPARLPPPRVPNDRWPTVVPWDESLAQV